MISLQKLLARHCYPPIDDYTVSMLASFCGSLQELDLGGMQYLTVELISSGGVFEDAGLCRLLNGNHLHLLSSLSLERTQIGDSSLETVFFDVCPHSFHLDCFLLFAIEDL